jgi:hypothetical protein
MRSRFHPAPIVSLGLLAAGLSGCASHVKGSWACALEPGVVCGSISDIDRGGPAKSAKVSASADPVIEGAIPARLWGQGGWSAGSIAGAPVREPDPVLKVALAPWIDGQGDYHTGAEIYAVMRHGGWFIAPKDSARRIDLARLSSPDLRPAPALDSAKAAATGAAASVGKGLGAAAASLGPPPPPAKPDKK